MLMIDGHNLIPKIPGLSLREMDDETMLLERLQVYARVRRKKVEVFFDGAPPGQAGDRTYGTILAHFVPAGRTADDAIQQRLAGMGSRARNVTVVTSDHMVQANARALHAQVLSSEDFSRELVDLKAEMDFQAAKARGKRRRTGETEQSGAAHNVDEWLDLFGIDPASADKPVITPVRKKPASPGRPAAPEELAAPKKAAGGSPARKKPRAHHGFPKK